MSTPIRPLSLATSVCRHCRPQYQRLPTLRIARASTTSQERPPDRLSNVAGQSADDLANAAPRWARTPAAMKAPHGTRPKNDNDEYPCNEDPRLLNSAYVKVLGGEGDKMLPEDVKWLAVTHKSFDHGRRGFNERLSFLGEDIPNLQRTKHGARMLTISTGRRIVELQTSLALLDAPVPDSQVQYRTAEDKFGRTPFRHESLRNTENVSMYTKEVVLDKRRLAQLAQRYGLEEVLRWKPRQVFICSRSALEELFSLTGNFLTYRSET